MIFRFEPENYLDEFLVVFTVYKFQTPSGSLLMKSKKRILKTLLYKITFKILMMKKILFLAILVTCCVFYAEAQVGIGTNNPEAALDVVSSNAGVLIPRVALNSETDVSTVSIPDDSGVAVSTMVYNDGSGSLKPTGFYYWDGTTWLQLVSDEPQVYFGKFKITASGNKIIVGLPFKPKRVEFKAYANVDDYVLNIDNGIEDDIKTKDNYFGYMVGFADQNGVAIEQQVIQGGANAGSINDHSRYSSAVNCIGFRYADDNGTLLGLTTASLTSFNPAGFTLNVNNFTDGVVVIYTAYKY